jgi:hypothetical protein
MDFEWDEAKSRRNVTERGLPFDFAIPLFDGPTLEWADESIEYGEDRTVAIGMVAGRCLVCVYTWRGSDEALIRRVIFLRKFTKRERKLYEEAQPKQS